MITVKVRGIFEFAALMGTREILISLPEKSSISDLLVSLVDLYGSALEGRLYKNSGGRELRGDFVLFLNGRNIFFLHGLDTVLEDGDDLFFLPPAGGG